MLAEGGTVVSLSTRPLTTMRSPTGLPYVLLRQIVEGGLGCFGTKICPAVSGNVCGSGTRGILGERLIEET